MQVSVLVWEVIGTGLGGALTLLIVFIVMFTGKIGHAPKRLDRIEGVLPAMIRALLCVLKNQKEGRCNGATEDSIVELNGLLTDGIVSQKSKT